MLLNSKAQRGVVARVVAVLVWSTQRGMTGLEESGFHDL